MCVCLYPFTLCIYTRVSFAATQWYQGCDSCIHIDQYTYTWALTTISAPSSVSMCVCVCACIHINQYTYRYLCPFVCVYVCVCVCVYIYIDQYTYRYLCPFTRCIYSLPISSVTHLHIYIFCNTQDAQTTTICDPSPVCICKLVSVP